MLPTTSNFVPDVPELPGVFVPIPTLPSKCPNPNEPVDVKLELMFPLAVR